MAMVQVGKMRVAMHEPGMPVPMRVRLAFRRLSPVAMPMMFIVQMRVLMLDRLVSMLVPVPLGQVEPDAESHKAAGGQQLPARLLAEHGTASKAPTNGATAKYAPVRAVPRCRSARMNKTRLAP